MATVKNSINNKAQDLTIDPGASGDSFVQFNINGTGEFKIGVDDDASDAFKISQGSALGTTDTFVMSAAGERTMPLQPAFLAYNSSTLLNVTGDNTSYTVAFDSKIYDQNSDYNTGTYTFTAPVTARYKVSIITNLGGCTASHNSSQIDLVTSNRSYASLSSFSPAAVKTVWGTMSLNATLEVDMDAADTAYVVVNVQGGTKVIVITGGASSTIYSLFSATLIC